MDVFPRFKAITFTAVNFPAVTVSKGRVVKQDRTGVVI